VKLVKKIAVIGSINIDYFIETDSFPSVGETVLGNHFFTNLGGKGANQAIAAARLGGEVTFFGSIGEDANSKAVIEQMSKEKVCLDYLNHQKDCPTGVAFIELSNSENRIIVISGANRFTDISYIKTVEDQILKNDVIVFQLETPIEMLEYLVPILYQQGKIIIVNPAPAKKIKTEIIDMITYLIPNEHEYSVVLDKPDQEMKELLEAYPNKLIVTMGIQGVNYFDGTQHINVPVIKVKAVDTTGAGDTFTGAFSVAIANDKSLYDSVTYANIAAGLSVTKKGAQAGMPTRSELG
jgi:ribokinase